MKNSIYAAFLFLCLAISSVTAFGGNTVQHLNIATTDTRPISIDRLVYTAFREKGYETSFTAGSMDESYVLADSGDRDGVISFMPDMVSVYPNLIKVPVMLEEASMCVFVPAGSGVVIDSWDEFAGLSVGIIAQNAYVANKLPPNTRTVSRNSRQELMADLARGDYDAVVFASRVHEELGMPSGVEFSGVIEHLTEYLYLHRRHAGLVSEITVKFEQLFMNNRAENILNNAQQGKNKTVVHLVSSTAEIAREERFGEKIREDFADDENIEWYSLMLSTRRFSMDQSRMAFFARLLRQDCVSRNISAIVASGPDAIEFLRVNYNSLFQNVPVIYYSVVGDDVQGLDLRFTGIIDRISAAETAQKALELFPDTQRLFVVNDFTREGSAYRAEMERQLQPLSERVLIEYNDNISREALLAYTRGLPDDSVVLIGSYFRDSIGQYYPQNDMKRALKDNCNVPIFTVYSTTLEYGAMGGKALDYEANGIVAADMLKRVLNGESVAASESSVRWVFDMDVVERWGKEAKALPEDARLLNKRISIWESDPLFVYGTILLFAVLSVCIFGAIRFNENRKSQKNLQMVLDMLPLPVRVVNADDGAITYGNRSALEMFGTKSLEEIYGLPETHFMPELQPDGMPSEQIMKALHSSADVSSVEMVCLDHEGKEVDMLITSRMVEYHGKHSQLEVLKDLTAEKQYQQRLVSAAEREKEANLLKSRFLVNMSHEIRTPMNSIIGLTEIELRKNPPNGEVFNKINNSAKNLLQIVNDILDLSKIEADKIELFNDEFELEDVISSAMLVSEPRLDLKTVEFLLRIDLDVPRFVIGDRTRLWQILKNFLDNSAKYTDEGEIVLSVSLDARSDAATAYITFIIKDTGIGIGEEQLKKIFTPYKQIYSEAQRRYTGTGLGMAISKQLCEIMGGEMQIESQVGVGTRISFTIPFKYAANMDTELSVVKRPELSGLNILVVDDDDVSLEIMNNLLSAGNARCVLTHSGEDALKKVFQSRDKGEAFDLILLDYFMDGINGLETARQIQAGLSRAPKLLMVTAYQRLLLKEELESSGIYDIIDKPLIPTQFMRKLLEALGLESEQAANDELVRFKDVRVLVFEDYDINQEVADGMISEFGIESVMADNGEQGLEILKTDQNFDLILMDLHMPVMDGYETSRNIRADSRFKDIPIISLTADAMTEVEEKCLSAGMNDHISKPITFAALNASFKKWLPAGKRTLSLDGGLARFGGKQDLYDKALSNFVRSLPDPWPDFAHAIANIEDTERLAHKLKGAAGNLGLDNFYKYANGFESSLRAGTPDHGLYRLLVSESKTLKKMIVLKLESAPAALSEGTRAELSERLGVLKEALIDCSPRACQEAVRELRAKTWPDVNDDCLQMCNHALQYEFDDALAILEKLLGGDH